MSESSFLTKRTTVRPIEVGDIEHLLEMYQEPESNKFIPPLVDRTEEEYREILNSKIVNNETEVGFWTVWSKSDNLLIGTLNLYYSDEFKVEHIGLHLSKKYWGKGFGMELMEALLKYGFEVRNLPEIHAIINHDHISSQKLFTKLGFRLKEKIKEDRGEAWVYLKMR